MTTELIYVDEQEGSTERGKYTAVVAAVIAAHKLHAFRSEYYSATVALLGANQQEEGEAKIKLVPLLHGSELLREQSDDLKVKMVDLLLGCFVRQGGTFARLGYYDKSFISGTGETRSKRLQTAITSLAITLSKRSSPFCFIHEIDQGEFKSGYRFLSEQLSLYYQLGAETVSFDAHNYIGSFVAPKYDLGCQVADISGYLAMKFETAETTFAKQLAAIFEKQRPNFILNELIWWNDPEKSG